MIFEISGFVRDCWPWLKLRWGIPPPMSAIWHPLHKVLRLATAQWWAPAPALILQARCNVATASSVMGSTARTCQVGRTSNALDVEVPAQSGKPRPSRCSLGSPKLTSSGEGRCESSTGRRQGVPCRSFACSRSRKPPLAYRPY